MITRRKLNKSSSLVGEFADEGESIFPKINDANPSRKLIEIDIGDSRNFPIFTRTVYILHEPIASIVGMFIGSIQN